MSNTPETPQYKKTSMAEVEAKKEELKKKHGCNIHAIVFEFNDGKENVVGYMKEPSRLVKLRVMDKAVMASFSAASDVLEAVLIKEESDPRLLSEAPEYDELYLGAVAAANSMIKFSANQFKKN